MVAAGQMVAPLRALLNPITLDADSQVGDATNTGTLNRNGDSFTLDGSHSLTVNRATNITGVISGSPCIE